MIAVIRDEQRQTTGSSSEPRLSSALDPVPTSHPIPPDAQQVDEVPHVTPHELESTIAVVTPQNTDLAYGKAESRSQNQNLDITHIAVDSSAFEDLIGA